MRLSVTTVEAFRLWRDTGDWMALETLEAQIKREAPPTDAMLRGRAFHAVLEHPETTFVDDMEGGHYEVDGYTFPREGIRSVLALMPPGRLNEVKATADIDGITLVGKADALYGITAFEAKLPSRIEVEKYFESFQWRAYIVLFHCHEVRYLLVQGKDIGNYVNIYDVLPMSLYRYPKVKGDVRRLTNDCAEFISQRGLDDYVKDAA